MNTYDDPVFFKGRDDFPWTNEAGTIEVRCMGEMRLDYKGQRITNANELIAAGLDTKEKLRAYENSDEGYDQWTFNPWFEVGVLEDDEWVYNGPAFSSLKDALAYVEDNYTIT